MRLFRKLTMLLGALAAAPVPAADASIITDAKTAASWISTALSQSGYKADFSIESLKEVDRFIEDQAPNGEPRPDWLLANNPGSRLFALGAYVGEVVLRAKAGTWEGNDKDPQAEINLSIVLEDGTRAWPVQRVMKRFENGEEDSVFAYGAALTAP
jgi:hypothetical protein